MATLKHLGSKNADYGAAEQYLLFEHDEFTMKPVLDETGRLIPPYAPLSMYQRSMTSCFPLSENSQPSTAGSAATSTRLPGI